MYKSNNREDVDRVLEDFLQDSDIDVDEDEKKRLEKKLRRECFEEFGDRRIHFID